MSSLTDPRPTTSTGGTNSGQAHPSRESGNAWRSIRLVAGREMKIRLTSRTFLLVTALFVLAVVGGGFLLKLAGGSSQATTVAFTSPTASLSGAVSTSAKAMGSDITTSTVANEKAGEQAIRDGDLDVLVTGTPQQLTVVVDKALDPSLQAMLTQVAGQVALSNEISSLGGDPATVAKAIASSAPTVRALEADSNDTANYIAGLVTGILLFVSLMSCGQLVAQGVVEEKSSRVVELLLATIRPWQLMAGKILGIGIVGLTQVALVVVAGVGTAAGLGLVDAGQINLGATAAWAVVWFVIGFAMYALALGSLAALVSRQEDVSSVISPFLGLMMVPYILGVSVAPWAPQNPAVVILSYVPFCSPLLMPIRIALESVETWQVLLAAGLNIAVIPVLVWLAGRIYSNAVLRTGTRVKLRDALRGA